MDGAPLARLGEAALMGRMRLGEERAFHEYLARFAPLLRDLAVRWRATGDDDVAIVDEVLEDVAIRIREHRMPRRVVLVAYLTTALRNRVLDARRARLGRARLEREIADDLEGAGEAAVLALSSAYAVRATRAPDHDDGVPVADALQRLHAFVVSQVDEEERRILGWVGEHVSHRDIAAWTGSTHGATRVRVHRLRARLERLARAWLERAPEDDRREILARYRAAGPPRRASQASDPPHHLASLPVSGGPHDQTHESGSSRATPAPRA